MDKKKEIITISIFKEFFIKDFNKIHFEIDNLIEKYNEYSKLEIKTNNGIEKNINEEIQKKNLSSEEDKNKFIERFIRKFIGTLFNSIPNDIILKYMVNCYYIKVVSFIEQKKINIINNINNIKLTEIKIIDEEIKEILLDKNPTLYYLINNIKSNENFYSLLFSAFNFDVELEIQRKICNFIYTQKIKPDILLYPKSLYYYKIKICNIEKNILMFGETHDKIFGIKNKIFDKIILNIFNFIYFILTMNLELQYNKKIDFYLESNYQYKTQYPIYEGFRYNGYIKDFVESFKDCIIKEIRNKCNFKNLRVHNADLRLYLMNIKKKENINDEYETKYNQYEEYEENDEYEEYEENDNKMKIEKTILDIMQEKEKKYKDELKSFESNENFINLINKQFKNSICKDIEKYNPLYMEKSILDSFIDKRNYLNYFFYKCSLMDYYILGRIFRKFSDDKNNIDNQNNIIIYAGDTHIIFYKNYIEYLNNNKVIEIKDKKESYENTYKDISLAEIDIFNLF